MQIWGVEGRTAIVCGSSSGLGYAVAELLARSGAQVMVVSRSAERVGQAVERIRAGGGPAVDGCSADFTDENAPQKVVAATRTAFGAPEIVVTNSGGPPGMPATAATASDLNAAAALLLLPVQRFAELTLPEMREAGWGRIVGITSIAAREPMQGLVLSNALRAAVTGYLKSVSDEVAADGVTVNTVCPGFTATDRLGELADFVAERDGVTTEDIFAGWSAMAPVRRLLKPEEVAAAVGFLCSDMASGITGVALAVDGGLGRSLI
ncbi:MAG: SDR family oxidoreductase [Acidobacteria bacterium]|nr:SDR family oxidoreductase [Acidobacteriota bacterium]